MTARGRRASWTVIVAASLFIAGYLLKYGEAAYTRVPPEAAPPVVVVQPAKTPPVSAPPARAEVAPAPTPAPRAEKPAPPITAPAPAVTPPPPPKQPAEKPARQPGPGPRPTEVQTLPTPPAASAPPPPAPAEEAPRLEWQQADFDFGSLYQNEEVTHEFAFRNTGQGPLKLGKISTSCGCTAAAPAATVIPPGGAGSIKVTFNSARLRDRIVKHVYVDSNDPAATRSVLTLRGLVKVEVDVVPSGIYFGSVKLGQTIERPVFLRPAEVKQFHVLEVKSTHPLITVGQPEPAPAPEPAGTYRILVRIGPSDQVTSINSHLLIRTDVPHAKEIDLPVYGRVVDLGEPRVTPSAR